jgi:hypothetical protein
MYYYSTLLSIKFSSTQKKSANFKQWYWFEISRSKAELYQISVDLQQQYYMNKCLFKENIV